MMRTRRLLTALAAAGAALWALDVNGQGSTCGTAVAIAGPGTYTADGPSAGNGAITACNNDDGTGGTAATQADWYTFTPASSGVLIVGSTTVGADTRLSIFSGSCGSLTCLGGDDDLNATVNTGTWETNNFRSRVAIPVSAGTTYYIMWDNLWSSLSFQWNLDFSADPAVGTTVASFPYTETFDGFATCLPAGTNTICVSTCAALGSGYTNNLNDVGDVYLRAGATGTGSTGPDFGFSGNTITDKYLYLESSLPTTIPMTTSPFCVQPYQVAVVTSPSFNTSAFTREAQVRFADHLFGATDPTRIGTLLAQYEIVSGSGNWVTFVNKTGSAGNQWNMNPWATLPLGTSSFRVRWIFIRGNFFQSDIGIDQVEVRERPDCSSPVASATVIENCQPTAGASTFTVSVTVSDFGSLSGVPETQCTVVPSSGAPQVVTSGSPTVVFGPYAYGTVVNFNLTHNSEPACNSSIPGTYRSCCGSACSTAFTPAIGVNANTNAAYNTCTGGATNAFDSGNPAPTSARWWAFTPASSGVYNISSCAQSPVTNNDTRVTVHTGTCGGLALYQADDDGCAAPVTFASDLNVFMAAGTTYYIEWDNAWGVNAAHTWSLTGPAAPVLGDVCTDAIGLTMGASCVNTLVSSAGATAETPSCAAGVGATTNQDVWMSFVATSALAQIDVTPVGTYYPVLELLSGTCGNLTSLCCTFGNAAGTPLTLLRGGLSVGQTYYLRIGHAFGGGDGGANQFNICVTEGVAPTPGCTFGTADYTESEPCGTLTNSDLCDAEPIVLGSLPFTFTIGGTIQAECNFRDRDFFIFTLPSTATYQIDWNAQFASRIFFLDANGPCADPLVQISSAASPACTEGTFTQSLAPGTYALMMTTDGIFNNITCGTINDYEITITAVPNLDCNLATPIACGNNNSVALSGTGIWSVTSCGFTTPGNEALYLLDATVAGVYNLTVTASNNQFIDYFIKPVSGGCAPSGWTCIQDISAAGTTVDFIISTPGQYWILADAETAGPLSSQSFRIFCPPAAVSTDFCTPIAVNCGDAISGQTSAAPAVFPTNACPYPVAPSTNGVNYWSITPVADAEITLSTCGSAGFDTRISVFAGVDCNNLNCVALNDDGAGCPNFSSEVRFPATAGVTYTIAVHGFGNAFGFYQLNVLCGPPCAPATSNDLCSNATVLTPAPDDGSGVPSAADNTCAFGDATTACDPFGTMQGLWYSFNSGPNSIMYLDLALGNATTLNYALYDGGCSGLGATGEVTCVIDGDGLNNTLPSLTPNTDYLLYVWNDGGVSQAGTFSVLLRRPGMNDAGITAITSPSGTLCSTLIDPVVTLTNFGENDLTSVTIVYDIDGGTPQSFAWTGNLAYLASETVALPGISTTQGPHTLNVTVALPNGAADEIAGNDAASSSLDISGETVVVSIRTDNNGGETSWSIFDAFFFPVANGGPYPGQNNTIVNTEVCLPTTLGNCFSFVVTDAGGDGLCCLNGAGYWELLTVNEQALLRDRFQGGNQSPSTTPVSPGYFAHDFCVPAGPSGVLSSECDIYTNTLQSKVYTQAVGGALNYQFEFSDPDAGFRRRIAVPRNWVAFGEMVTNPLTPGTVYFARARVDQGASGFSDDRFGTGCEMGIDAASIGCAQLIDNISLPTHSCGVNRAFGGSDKIWAVPIYGATQYRFRFSGGLIDPDGPTGPNAPIAGSRTILRSSYVCLLNWATFTLVNGQTYSVTVEALVSGVWTGFCGAACNVTISNPPAFAGRAMVNLADDALAAELYPNPVRDGRVTLQLTGLGEGDHRIGVEVFDLYGKRVQSVQLGSTGDRLNEVLELNGANAAGLYLVAITVDGQVTTKRLSVLH